MHQRIAILNLVHLKFLFLFLFIFLGGMFCLLFFTIFEKTGIISFFNDVVVIKLIKKCHCQIIRRI